MKTLGVIQSACRECRRIIPAKVVSRKDGVHAVKFCPGHGESVDFIHGDAAAYLQAQRYVKPASIPNDFHGDAGKHCPEGCGFCERHELHLCLPIIEMSELVV